MIATVQILAAFVFSIIDQSFKIFEANAPLFFEIPTPTSDKIIKTQAVREVFFILSIACTTLSALTIALVWNEVAEKAKKLHHRGLGSLIPRTRTALVIFEVCIIPAMIISEALYFQVLSVLLAVLIILVTFVVYSVGYCKIRQQLATMSELSPSTKTVYKKVVDEIFSVAAGIIVMDFSLLGLIIVVLVNVNWRESSPPNSVPLLIIIWQALVGCLLSIDYIILFALKRVTKRRVAKSSEVTTSNPDEKSVQPRRTTQAWDESTVSRMPVGNNAFGGDTTNTVIAAYHTTI